MDFFVIVSFSSLDIIVFQNTRIPKLDPFLSGGRGNSFPSSVSAVKDLLGGALQGILPTTKTHRPSVSSHLPLHNSVYYPVQISYYPPLLPLKERIIFVTSLIFLRMRIS